MLVIFLPSTSVMMSPPRLTSAPSIVAEVLPPSIPALSAGPPLTTDWTITPFLDRQVDRLRQVGGDRAAADAEEGVFDFAVSSSWWISARTVSIGIAKPMPTLPLPPPPVSIWELIPITSPAALISGPPELPGLIAASVWITLEIEKPLGAWIWRCSAETMPLVTVRSSPNGLPIATTGSPTSISAESPSVSGCSWSAGRVDLEQGEVGGRVGADHFGRVGRCRSRRV